MGRKPCELTVSNTIPAPEESTAMINAVIGVFTDVHKVRDQ